MCAITMCFYVSYRFCRTHRSEEQSSHFIDLASVDANTIDWEFSQNFQNLSHGVNSIPIDHQQTFASTNDELIFLTMNWEAEADGFFTDDSEHVHLVVVVEVHLENLTSKHITPEHHVGIFAMEKIFSNEVHDAVVHLFNFKIRHDTACCIAD